MLSENKEILFFFFDKYNLPSSLKGDTQTRSKKAWIRSMIESLLQCTSQRFQWRSFFTHHNKDGAGRLSSIEDCQVWLPKWWISSIVLVGGQNTWEQEKIFLSPKQPEGGRHEDYFTWRWYYSQKYNILLTLRFLSWLSEIIQCFARNPFCHWYRQESSRNYSLANFLHHRSWNGSHSPSFKWSRQHWLFFRKREIHMLKSFQLEAEIIMGLSELEGAGVIPRWWSLVRNKPSQRGCPPTEVVFQ